MTGVGEFDIDPGATVGAEWDGVIDLTYDLFSVDPNSMTFDPDADTISTGNVKSEDASIDIVASTSTPEPTPGILTGLFCLALYLIRARAATGGALNEWNCPQSRLARPVRARHFRRRTRLISHGTSSAP